MQSGSRVFRCGGWDNDEYTLRCEIRKWLDPQVGSGNNQGFHVVIGGHGHW